MTQTIISPTFKSPVDALGQFGLKEFRRGQREIIESVLSGRDTISVLPTGGGKSLCYQVPALMMGKIVVVVSPLIALMRDQVATLTKWGIPAGCLYSGQEDDEKRTIFGRMHQGGSFLLYLSPERVQKEAFQRWVMQRQIGLFAIDEAHCVSQWGHDFREEYGQLKLLKKLKPEVPILALTASATPLVLNDVSKNLGLVNPSRHVHGFYRPNLYYQVETCEDEEEKFDYLHQAITQFPQGRIIVYCGTRKSSEEVADSLSKFFDGVDYYHAGLNGEKRSKVQDHYAQGKIRILAATNAFGMGIDHPDIRLVVHYQMPANIDSLYQEMGRAGRDGASSTCLMLYSKRDKGLQSYFIRTSRAHAEIKSSRWKTLDAMIAYAEGGECRHGEILTYYQDSQRIKKCDHCDSCKPESERKISKPETSRAEPLAVSAKVSLRNKKPKKEKDFVDAVLDPLENERFQALKDWRKEKASELDVAAFMVFSDKTLRHLSSSLPKTKDSLLKIHGIGAAKAETFGNEVLQLLKSW